jgi:hypothetical protein
MRDKYRQAPAETVSDNQPTIKIEVNGEPIAEPVREALNQASAADAATEALKAQIAALKRGEEMHRQHAEAQAEVAAKAEEWKQSPPSHKDLLDHWEKLHGMPRVERLFLEEHPELIDNRELTAQAALEAHQQGLERGTDAFNQATLAGFHRHLQGAQRQVEQPERPAPPMLAAPERDLSAIVSAPVSREAPSAGDGSRNRPGRITLTAEERNFARTIGLSEENYAKQKLRLLEAQANGEHQR